MLAFLILAGIFAGLGFLSIIARTSVENEISEFEENAKTAKAAITGIKQNKEKATIYIQIPRLKYSCTCEIPKADFKKYRKGDAVNVLYVKHPANGNWQVELQENGMTSQKQMLRTLQNATIMLFATAIITVAVWFLSVA